LAVPLKKLRAKRIRIHRQLNKWEPLVAGYHSRLSEVEAEITRSRLNYYCPCGPQVLAARLLCPLGGVDALADPARNSAKVLTIVRSRAMPASSQVIAGCISGVACAHRRPASGFGAAHDAPPFPG
jgi:hypothetical protein